MSTKDGATKRKAPDQGGGDTTHLALSIKSQDGRQLFFKVNRNAPFIRVFRDYCNRMSLEYETMRFLYNGRRILGKQTAKKLNMENDDEIEILAVENVLGGGVAALSFYQHDIDMALY